MFYETCTPFESFPTHVTLIGLLSRRRNGLLAQGLLAVIGALSGMDLLVVSEICDVTEVFPTVIAMVGFHLSQGTFILSES